MIDTSYLVLYCIKQASSRLVNARFVLSVCLFVRPSPSLSVCLSAFPPVHPSFIQSVIKFVGSVVLSVT